MTSFDLYQEVCRALGAAGYTCTGAGSRSANRRVTQSSTFWREADCVSVCLEQTVLDSETGGLSDGMVTVSSRPGPANTVGGHE